MKIPLNPRQLKHLQRLHSEQKVAQALVARRQELFDVAVTQALLASGELEEGTPVSVVNVDFQGQQIVVELEEPREEAPGEG